MRTELSSPLTFAFKFVFFPLWSLMLLSAGVFTAVEIRKWDVILVMCGFILAMWALAWFRIRDLRVLSYDDNYLFVKNFNKEEKFELRDIKSISGGNLISFSPFFEIEFYSNKDFYSVNFIPSFMEHLTYSAKGKFSGRTLVFKNLVGEIQQEISSKEA